MLLSDLKDKRLTRRRASGFLPLAMMQLQPWEPAIQAALTLDNMPPRPPLDPAPNFMSSSWTSGQYMWMMLHRHTLVRRACNHVNRPQQAGFSAMIKGLFWMSMRHRTFIGEWKTDADTLYGPWVGFHNTKATQCVGMAKRVAWHTSSPATLGKA